MLKKFLTDNFTKNQQLKQIYRLIQYHKQITKNELLEKTDTKQTTLTRMIDELLEKKLIKESGYGSSSGGRPPILYKIDEKVNFLIGIEISRSETKVILLDLF